MSETSDNPIDPVSLLEPNEWPTFWTLEWLDSWYEIGLSKKPTEKWEEGNYSWQTPISHVKGKASGEPTLDHLYIWLI